MDIGRPHRLSPGRAHLRRRRRPRRHRRRRRPPAQNRPPTVQRAVRSVHGRSRQDLDGHRRRPGSGRRPADLSRGARRRARSSPADAPDAVDGADGRRPRAGHRTVRRRQGRHRVRHRTIQVVKAAVKELVFEDVHFDFDRYTLRPEATRVLDEAIARCRRTRRCGSRSKATPATSARPSTTWRSANAAPPRSATT